MRRTVLVIVLPLLLLVGPGLAGCRCDPHGNNCELVELAENNPPPPPIAIRIWSGDNQVGLEGQKLAEQIVGQITGGASSCVFEIEAGDGTIQDAGSSDLSDIPGKIVHGDIVGQTIVGGRFTEQRCGASWVLGAAGVNTMKLHFFNYLSCTHVTARGRWLNCARESFGFVRFTARGHGPAAKLVVRDGDGQTGEAGQALPVRPHVRVTDAGDNPVPGINVAFAAMPGSGTPESPVSATTSNLGDATMPVDWVLSLALGSQFLQVIAGDEGSPLALDGNPALFYAIAQPPAPPPPVPARIEIVEGDNQQTLAGSPVPLPVRVKVTSGDGTPVPGALVDFVPDYGSVSISPAMTDADGIATPGTWRPGFNQAGTFHLTATARGENIADNPVQFTATTSIGQGGTNTLQLYNGTSGAANIFIEGETLAAGNSVGPSGIREVQIYTAVNTSVGVYAYIAGSQVATTRCTVTAAAWQGPLDPLVALFREGSFYFLLCNNF